jgi:hypothetical protein
MVTLALLFRPSTGPLGKRLPGLEAVEDQLPMRPECPVLAIFFTGSMRLRIV